LNGRSFQSQTIDAAECQTGWQNLALKNFGNEEYQNVAYFNFDEQPELKQFFSSSKDVKRIVQNLGLVYGKAIQP
jgi:hypothetical protein